MYHHFLVLDVQEARDMGEFLKMIFFWGGGTVTLDQ